MPQSRDDKSRRIASNQAHIKIFRWVNKNTFFVISRSRKPSSRKSQSTRPRVRWRFNFKSRANYVSKYFARRTNYYKLEPVRGVQTEWFIDAAAESRVRWCFARYEKRLDEKNADRAVSGAHSIHYYVL